ncbi:MAG: aldose 1-epimerase [Sediminibacterium sp.]
MPFDIVIDKSNAYPVITLQDTGTGCQAEIYAFGGLLNAFRIREGKNFFNVVNGFSSVEDARENILNGCKSAKLSPFVCRMHKGIYSFRNHTYKVNGHYLGEHAIHGLMCNSIYEIVAANKHTSGAYLTLHARYTGTDPGYPFPYNMILNWKLETGNRLTITTTAQHNNPYPIPFADGWHPYFTLGSSIDDCHLQFTSQAQLEFSKDLLPTGNILTDKRFMEGSALKDISLDNCFVLDPSKKISRCVLKNKQRQLTIEPDPSYPYLQVYTPAHRKSIAIENLSSAPDAFNNHIGLVTLEPDKPISFTTSYSLVESQGSGARS